MVSLVCRLNKNYNRRDHTLLFKKMPNMKAYLKEHSLPVDLTLVTGEETILEILWPLPLHVAWKWPGGRGLQPGTLRPLTIHMEFPKGEHRWHLKPWLTALPFTFYPTSSLCDQSPPFQEGNLGKLHSQPSHHQVFLSRFTPPRVLGHTCPALALPTRKRQPPSASRTLPSSALSPQALAWCLAQGMQSRKCAKK